MAKAESCYAIIAAEYLNSIDFDELSDTAKNTVRKSIDGKNIVIEWTGKEVPDSIAKLESYSGPHSHEEIIALLNDEKWVSTDDK